MAISYVPSPLDTSGIVLGPELQALLECLAKNTHDVWARGRLDESWCYGKRRDDKTKRHPCLVPYSQLDDSEKAYDRHTAEEALKAILKLGFSITPPQGGTPETTGSGSELPFPISDSFDYEQSDALWREHVSEVWKCHPAWYRDFGNLLLKKDEALFAYDVLTEACRIVEDPAWADRLRLRRAFAMAEVGAAAEAVHLLRKPVVGDMEIQERWETLGRLNKDLSEPAVGRELSLYRRRSAECYEAGYKNALEEGNFPSAYYCAINVATLGLLQGRKKECREWTGRVRRICSCLADSSPKDFWLQATLGEASLLEHDLETALAFYHSAVALAGDDVRAVRSMAKQALRIAKCYGIGSEEVASWFHLHTDVCVVGPEHASQWSQKQVPPLGNIYASLTGAEDIERIGKLISRGAKELHLVLPFSRERFQEGLPTHLEKPFAQLLSRAATLEYIMQTPGNSADNVCDFARIASVGKAMLRSMDGFPLSLVTERDGRFLVSRSEDMDSAVSQCRSYPVPNGESFNYLPLLFADVKGFSKLENLQLESFVQAFWKLVGEIRTDLPDDILQAQTAGDGLFMAFRRIDAAAAFGLTLADRVREENWESHGLPRGISIRISLDCGPCSSYPNPVSRNRCFCGAVVNRAARIEPVTPPGKVYVSDAFVYTCLALGLQDYAFSYVGRTTLPKGFGVLPLFHLRKAN